MFVFVAGKTREAEVQRVDKELANIRKAFTSGTMSEFARCPFIIAVRFIVSFPLIDIRRAL